MPNISSNPNDSNQRLTGILKILKSEDPNFSYQFIKEFNSILNTAIINFPEEVNSVQVDLEINTSIGKSRDSNEYLGAVRSITNNALRGYLNVETLPEKVYFTFFKHLPYDLKGDSGHFYSGLSDGPRIPTVNMFKRMTSNIGAAVSISLTDSDLNNDTKAVFLIDEIKNIQLVKIDNTKYTPIQYVPRLHEYADIYPAIPYELHFLRFMGFDNPIKAASDLKCFSKKDVELVTSSSGNVLLPIEGSNLLNLRAGKIAKLFQKVPDDKFFSGYAAIIIPLDNEIILYNFNDEQIPNEFRRSSVNIDGKSYYDGHKSVAVTVANLKMQGYLSQFDGLTGNNLVSKLAHHPLHQIYGI